MDFTNITYLQQGNGKQQHCYHILTAYRIMDILKDYDPLVAGTIPIAIDVENSDIDIICYAAEFKEFQKMIRKNFDRYKYFSDTIDTSRYVAAFEIEDLPIEIYAEAIPSRQQFAYRHMLIEYHIIQLANDDFRKQIIALKQNGYKTEPAFGKLLHLQEPYSELLTFEKMSDEEIVSIISKFEN